MNFENRLIFREVIDTSRVSCFFTRSVQCVLHDCKTCNFFSLIVAFLLLSSFYAIWQNIRIDGAQNTCSLVMINL